MAFWICYYHIIWATKQRQPLIDAKLEPILFEAIRRKSAFLDARLLAINGVEDHIHAAVCIPPKLSIADWVQQVKGYSTREANAFDNQNNRFSWQASYGVMTFGQKQLDTVLAYIAHQKEHHQNNTLNSYLERTDGS